MTPTEYAQHILSSWAVWLERDQRPTVPHPYAYASNAYPCLRRIVYDMRGTPRPPWEPERLARMRTGNDKERDTKADMNQIGRDADPPFRIVGDQQRFTVNGHERNNASRLIVVGKIDGFIECNGLRAPLEIKNWASHIVSKIDTFPDLYLQPWTRSGAIQLLTYMYASDSPVGFMVLTQAGLPKILPVSLEDHLDHIEAFLVMAERALDHFEAGTLPPYLEDDPNECARCPFFGSECNPPLVHEAATVLDDPALEAALKRRDELASAAKEFEAWDTDIKKRLRGVEAGVCGEFLIRGKWSASSRVELPPDLKKQFTVKDAKARFTLEITRVTP